MLRRQLFFVFSITNLRNVVFLTKFFLLTGAAALFDLGHPRSQPFGRPSFGIRPIRLSMPKSGCGNLPRCVVLLFFITVMSGCSEEHLSKQSEFALPQKHKTSLTREEKHGKELYEYYCALCHGTTGEGDGVHSFNLKTPPAKHTDATHMAALSDAQIRKVIKEGGSTFDRSPQMPRWGGVLTDKEVSNLTAFIRTLAQP
ncbi:MAG: cytochrome c [Nitrospinota bacterium]|jgi:cytochrome c553|nr:cytochrome c [Nitrospinota bacterium]